MRNREGRHSIDLSNNDATVIHDLSGGGGTLFKHTCTSTSSRCP